MKVNSHFSSMNDGIYVNTIAGIARNLNFSWFGNPSHRSNGSDNFYYNQTLLNYLLVEQKLQWYPRVYGERFISIPLIFRNDLIVVAIGEEYSCFRLRYLDVGYRIVRSSIRCNIFVVFYKEENKKLFLWHQRYDTIAQHVNAAS